MKTSINSKEIILSLIKDDLINSKLVNGLNELGLNAGCYFTNACQTVFQLMEMENHPNEEEIFQQYVQLSAKVKHIDISESHEPLDGLCEEIYDELDSRLQDSRLKTAGH